MDLRDLRYFETIAELEHVGKATEKLHRTQPALTSCIRRLEEAAGAPLFEKSGRGIRLTPAGRVLLKWARQLRLDADDARREIQGIGRGLSGHIRLGIVPTPAQFLLPPVVRQLMREAPDVTLRTEVGLVDMMRPRLRAGELDLMIGTESHNEPDFVSVPLTHDTIVVAASAHHELLTRPARVQDLCRFNWVLQPTGAPTRDWLDHTFDRHRLPRPVVQIESTMLLMLPSLIAETSLLSFISRQHLEGPSQIRGLAEVPIKEAAMHRRLVVTHRANGFLSPATQRLMALFVQSVQEGHHP
jgi:DNA-binding transcriptional LysR family regulator